MRMNVQGTNLELTDELRAFLDEKLQDCYRALGNVSPESVGVDVELERTTRRYTRDRPHEQRYRAEANVSVPGRLIRAEASAHDPYQAIVKLKKTLTRKLRTWRERIIDDARKGARAATARASEAEPAEDQALEDQALEDLRAAWEDEERARPEAAATEGDGSGDADDLEGDDLRDFV